MQQTGDWIGPIQPDGLGAGQEAGAFQNDLNGRLKPVGNQDGLADLEDESGGQRPGHGDTHSGTLGAAKRQEIDAGGLAANSL